MPDGVKASESRRVLETVVGSHQTAVTGERLVVTTTGAIGLLRDGTTGGLALEVNA